MIKTQSSALPSLGDLDPRRDRVTAPLAPGAPIAVGPARRRAGIAAVVVMGGRPHLITCGHVFEGRSGLAGARGDASVFAAEGGGPAIATLTRSFLDDAPRLDAAVCELTADGIALLKASKGARTWFTSCRDPAAGDEDELAVFWPTHDGAGAPFAIKPSSHDASTQVLFPGGPHAGFIKLPFTAKEGDSGSVLAMGGAYYALCSGQAGTSYFTPIASILRRLKKENGDVELWHP